MIELKQLRLGNYILPNNADFFEELNGFPKELQISDILYIIEFPKQSVYEYIKITKQLLERCYFKNDGKTIDMTMKVGMTSFVLLENGGVFTVLLSQFDEDNNIKDTVILFNDIEYLHQLQNIIYSISNIELMDLVAFNYANELFLKVNNQESSMSFEDFMNALGKAGERHIWFANMWVRTMEETGNEYEIGDLPPTLFI